MRHAAAVETRVVVPDSDNTQPSDPINLGTLVPIHRH